MFTIFPSKMCLEMPKHILALPNIMLHILVLPTIDLGIFFEKKVGLDQRQTRKEEEKKTAKLTIVL